MARTPRPWFWKERNGWYVVRDGRRLLLAPHPADAPLPRKRNGRWVVPPPIQLRYHQLSVGPVGPKPTGPPAGPSVDDVFEWFLDWCERHRAPRTYQWYRAHLQSFLDAIPGRPFPAHDLRPFHVQQWADGRPTWGPNHRRGAITAVQRAFSWAEKQGHVGRSPVRHVDKPPPRRREQVLTRAEFDALLAHVRDQPFRDVLEFCWETGCRVQEVRVLAARHLRADRGRFELPPAEAKGGRRRRIIYLTDRAAEIARRLARRYPDGPVFRNADGNPWDAQAFNNRFCRLRAKVGVKYALTAVRHSFATRLLEAGVDHITVAALLGHVDATMLSRVYQHVGEKTDFLRDELRRAAGGGTAGP